MLISVLSLNKLLSILLKNNFTKYKFFYYLVFKEYSFNHFSFIKINKIRFFYKVEASMHK